MLPVWQSCPVTDDVDRMTDEQWLDEFVSEWHLLADLSFSDLVLWRALDDGDVFEVGQQSGPAIITAFARVDGRPVGVIANQPTRLPVVVGQTTPVKVTVTNRGKAATSGSLKLDLPAGVDVEIKV